MSEPPLHRLYHHFSEVPLSLRILFTSALCVLGLGYLFALIYLFTSHSGKDGNRYTLSYQDVVITYAGTGKGSRIEAALGGPMSAMLPAEESRRIVSWVQEGAGRDAYENEVRPILDKRCLTCHDGSNPHLANLDGYDNVKKTTERDTGTGLSTLVRVSHIHLFGLTFIFFIVGFIFSHAYVRPVWLKGAVVALPFVCIVIDVGSWYLVKLYHPFAWVTMASGGVLGLSFGFMWVVSMYQMWWAKTPPPVTQRAGADIRAIG